MESSALSRSRRLVLGAMLERAARRSPDTVALVFGERRQTFRELDERVNRLANALHDRGIAQGDRVAVLMHNGIPAVESFFACAKLGALCVPLNFRLVAGEIHYMLADSGARAILADPAMVAVAVEAARGTDVVFVVADGSAGSLDVEDLVAAASPAVPAADVREHDAAFVMYTSGTTGVPKGAMLSHLNLMTNTANWIIEMQAAPEDVWLSGVPLFHIGGLNGVLPFIQLGGTSVITVSTGFSAPDSLHLLERHRVTMCYFVPTQWEDLSDAYARHPVDLSRLRRALWGASPATPATLRAMAATFPHVGFVSAFGQTEMSSNTAFLQPAYAVSKQGSVGRAAVNVEHRIVDARGDDVAPGEVGEIVYRGPTVMQGYFGRPVETAESFDGGWFHSGDLVREDEDGFLWVVDRKKDMIVSGGENIYPAEVERVLAAHPAVRDVAVFGVPDQKWGETPVAAVVVTDQHPVAATELIAHVKASLASYKKPTDIVFLDALPRNAAGKVLRRVLRESYLAARSDTPREEIDGGGRRKDFPA